MNETVIKFITLPLEPPVGSLSWIELRDMWPAQTTIWLLPQKTSEALPCKASEVFSQDGENLCDTNKTVALQSFPVWGPDNSDSVGRWFESSRAYQVNKQV